MAFSFKLNFQSSMKMCQSEKSRLANVTSKDEEIFLLDQMSSHTGLTSTDIIWLGGHFNAKQSTWLWLDEIPILYTGEESNHDITEDGSLCSRRLVRG